MFGVSTNLWKSEHPKDVFPVFQRNLKVIIQTSSEKKCSWKFQKVDKKACIICNLSLSKVADYSANLRSGLQITEKSHIWYERFLNTLLVSFIVCANLIMRFCGPHSLAGTKTTGFESWKMLTLSFCSWMLNIWQLHKFRSC